MMRSNHYISTAKNGKVVDKKYMYILADHMQIKGLNKHKLLSSTDLWEKKIICLKAKFSHSQECY